MKTVSKKIHLYNIIFVLLISTAVFVISYLNKYSYGVIVRNTIMILIGSVLFIATLTKKAEEEKLLFDNALHLGNLFAFSVCALGICSLFPYIPITGWSFPLVFVLAALLSDEFSGGILGTVLLTYSCLINSNCSVGEFSLMLFSGILSIVIFSDFSRKFADVSTFVSFIMINLSSSLISMIFFINGGITGEQILVMAFNGIVSLFVLFWVCNKIKNLYIRKEELDYMDINDQSFKLLIDLKSSNSEEYMRAIHCSHFAQLISNEIGLDTFICKGGAYYSRMDLFEDNDKTVFDIMKENNFPEVLVNVLTNIFSGGGTDFISSEEFVILLCEDLTSRIYDLKKNNKLNKDNYCCEVNSLLDTFFIDPRMEKLQLTFGDFNRIRKILLDEDKYIALI